LLDNGVILLNFIFPTSADFSFNPVGNFIVKKIQPGHCHPPFIIDFVMPLQHSKHIVTIPFTSGYVLL
jgi:hypothetical protein